jgi:uncharacterized membrane protein YjfL (UPF0719 family)
MSFVKDLFEALPPTLPLVVLVLTSALALWWIINWLTPFDDEEEMFTQNNVAYTLQRVGILAGFCIALLPVISDYDKEHILPSLGWLSLEAIWVGAILLMVRRVVDTTLLPKVSNTSALKNGNLAVGIAECGAYLAAGLITGAALVGSANSTWLSVFSSTVFALLGIGLVGLVVLLAPYQLRERIEHEQVASAYLLVGLLIGSALVVRVGVAGDFTSWSDSLVAFSATALLAVVTLLISWWLVDLVVLRLHTVKEVVGSNLTAPAVVMMASLISVALVVAEVFRAVL